MLEEDSLSSLSRPVAPPWGLEVGREEGEREEEEEENRVGGKEGRREQEDTRLYLLEENIKSRPAK